MCGMAGSDPERPSGAAYSSSSLSAELEPLDEGVAVVVTGELDVVTAPKLDERIEHALRDRPPLLLIDLTGVTFLGSAGMTSLVAAHRIAGDTTTVRIVATGRSTARAMQIVGLDQQLAIFASREEALAHRPPSG